MGRPKKSRSAYRGCFVEPHHGKLRLSWRYRPPGHKSRRERWATGEPDTPLNRLRWDRVAEQVAAHLAIGNDPLPYLREHVPTAPTTSGRKPEGQTTVREFYEEWIQSKAGGAVHPSCLNDYQRHMTRYILPTVGALPLATMRPIDVQLLQSHLRTLKHHRTGKPLSEKTIIGVLGSVFRAFLRDAMVQDLVKRDLFVGITWKEWNIPPASPFEPEERERIIAWFREQTFQRHLRWRPHPAFHAYVFFLFWHGARPSEGAGLFWAEHIDLRKGLAYVEQSYHYKEYGPPKTRKSRRSIELHPTMVQILRDLRPLHVELGQPVFPNMDGRRITPKTFWGLWKRCLEELRIKHRGEYAMKDTFVTHTLRIAEETGEVEKLTAWLVRQTGVRLDTLKQHYEKWWPRDTAQVHATYATLDPRLNAPTKRIGSAA